MAERKWWHALLLAGALGISSLAGAETMWPPIGEPVPGSRITGRWLWSDLVTADAGKASEFYAALFGWEIHSAAGEPERPVYLTISVKGRAIGGIVQSSVASGARWIGLASGDPKVLAERAAQRGGKVVVTPQMLAGRGQFEVLSDPAGAHFGVVMTDRGDPADHLGGLNEWLWDELWTPDPAAAASFYRDVFGYTVASAPRSTARGEAYVLSAGGRARAGIMRSPDSTLPAVWIPYVRVDDVDATVLRAQRLGARVLVAAHAHHRSKVAVLADPQGAPFAVAEWRPQP